MSIRFMVFKIRERNHKNIKMSKIKNIKALNIGLNQKLIKMDE